jgi:hypothetical protein
LAGETSDGADGVEGAVAGLMVRLAVRVTPLKTPEIVADVDAVTEVVVIVKLALVAPAGTVTVAGTAAAFELSVTDTATPPLGAAPLKVTVPVEELPPATLAGFSDNAESVGAEPGGFTVIAANWNTLSSAAES